MAEESFDVFVTGFEPTAPEAPQATLSRVLRLEPERARELVRRLPCAVLENVSYAHAEEYAALLRIADMRATVVLHGRQTREVLDLSHPQVSVALHAANAPAVHALAAYDEQEDEGRSTLLEIANRPVVPRGDGPDAPEDTGRITALELVQRQSQRSERENVSSVSNEPEVGAASRTESGVAAKPPRDATPATASAAAGPSAAREDQAPAARGLSGVLSSPPSARINIWHIAAGLLTVVAYFAWIYLLDHF